MTKPVIVKRETKGAPLTYTELDANFQNLDDATITVNGDTGSISNNLNGTMTIAGGTALTSSVSGTTLTLNLDNTAVTAGSYTSANITVDAQGRITAASSGSGGVGTGVVNRLSYYDTTTSINDSTIAFSHDSGTLTDTLQGTSNNYFVVKSKNGVAYVSLHDVISGATEAGITLHTTYGYVGIGGEQGVSVSGPLTASSSNAHSFFPKVQSASINTAFDTGVAMDNLNVRIHSTGGSNGQLQASAVSGSFTAYVTTLGNIAGNAVAGDTSSSGITFTAGTWTSCNFRFNLGSGGDVIEAHIMDYTNSRLYRVTVMHGNNTTGGFISIERMI